MICLLPLLTRSLGIRLERDVEDVPQRLQHHECEEDAVEAVARLAEDIGIPARLSEVGVTADRVDALAADAESSGIHATTPRKPSLQELKALIEQVC